MARGLGSTEGGGVSGLGSTSQGLGRGLFGFGTLRDTRAMAMAEPEQAESCGSRPLFSSSHPQRQKLDMYNDVLRRIQEINPVEASLPDFDEELWLHFNRLPARLVSFLILYMYICFHLGFKKFSLFWV